MTRNCCILVHVNNIYHVSIVMDPAQYLHNYDVLEYSHVYRTQFCREHILEFQHLHYKTKNNNIVLLDTSYMCSLETAIDGLVKLLCQ